MAIRSLNSSLTERMAAIGLSGDVPGRPARTLFWRVKAKSQGQENESAAKLKTKEGRN